VQPQPSATGIPDAKHLFGFVWKMNPQPTERINGDNFYDHGSRPFTMEAFADPQYEQYGYPSSGHSGGVNVAYSDGHIDFLTEGIAPEIYAMLMTSNRNRSTFVFNGTPDRKLTQPAADDI
jgi:prepilin-type processing-associated H-X9-DG protein